MITEGSRVRIVGLTLDALTAVYGFEGDGDMWDRSDEEDQRSLVGEVGTVQDIDRYKDYGKFYVVRFDDGQCFTFFQYDVEQV